MILFKKVALELLRSRPKHLSFGYLLISILIVIIVGYALIFSVSYLPQVPLRQNTQKAHAEGYFSENYPKSPYYMHILNKQLDMYTECIALGIAVNMRSDMKSLLSMPTFGECSKFSQAVAGGFEQPASPYMRYIHGYQVFLKPLYTFFTIDTVRLVTCAITLSLLLLLFVTLRNHLNTAYATVVVLSFFVTRSASVFFLVTHAAQFWLVLLGATLVVRLHKHVSSFFLFGILGACDTFFTFLNMGSLSLGIPLFCYALTLWKNNKESEEIIAALFWGGVGWSIGFVIPWLLKWTVLELALQPTKQQLFGATLEAYPAHSVQMILTALNKNIRGLSWRFALVVCSLLIIRQLWLRLPPPSSLWVATLPALVPIIWVCILPGQSGVLHAFFINVILWPCIAAIFLMLLAIPKPCQR